MAKTRPFDQHADDYEKWFDLNKFAYESELHAIRHFIPGNGRGVEIGIGSGLFAQPVGITEGVEPSEQMRTLAGERGLKVKNGVAENVPLEDSKFDYVLMVTTICFVDDLKKTFAEARRILKPSGHVIIGFVDKNSRIGNVYQQNKQFSTFYKEALFYSSDEIKKELKDSGFHNIEFVQTLFGKLKEIDHVQDYKKGYGEGSFVVVKGEKRK